MALDRAHGIILKGQKFRETSKILRVFTEEFGKISLIAKGVRSAKSRSTGTLETLNYIEFSFYRKPGQDLYLLRQADLVESFRTLRDSSEATAAALAMSEIVYTSTLQEAPHPELLITLVGALQALNRDAARPMNHYLRFLLQVQQTHGCSLSVDRCVVTDNPLPDGSVPFDLDRGGAIGPQTANAAMADSQITPEARKVTAFLQTCGADAVDRIVPSAPCRRELTELYHRYMRYHIEGFVEPQALKLLTITYQNPERDNTLS